MPALDQEGIASLQEHEILSENVSKQFEHNAQFRRTATGGERLQGESKSGMEIRHLHEKIDHLLRKQYKRLFEIQQIQIELLEQLGHEREPANQS